MYLVTGGGGFIGSHLVRALVERGERVRVLDNGYSGSRQSIGDLLADVEWIDGDVRDYDQVYRACRGVEIVLHHAAIASVPETIAEPLMTHAVNATGTLNVLMAARQVDVHRVVFASSSAVYGDSESALADAALSESRLPAPCSPYGVQKLTGEAYCRVWYDTFGLETVALRYFNVYGPGQQAGTDGAVIPRFFQAILQGEPVTIYGDGLQSRDFVYVSDVVEVNLRAASTPAASGRVFNVGTGRALSIRKLVEELEYIVGQPIPRDYTGQRRGDIWRSIADISALREMLGFVPTVSLTDGLTLTAQAMRASREANTQVGRHVEVR